MEATDGRQPFDTAKADRRALACLQAKVDDRVVFLRTSVENNETEAKAFLVQDVRGPFVAGQSTQCRRKAKDFVKRSYEKICVVQVPL